jgi:hypothetical protein
MTPLILSESFAKVLSVSSQKDKVRDIIMDAYLSGKPHNLSFNFIGLGSEPDEVTFVNSSKLKPFTEKGESNWKVRSFLGVLGQRNNSLLFTELGVDMDLLIPEPARDEITRKPLNIISERDKNGKTYCLVGVRDKSVIRQFVINKSCLVNTTIQDYVDSLTTSVGKVGRVIKSILKDINADVTDQEVESFVNYFKSSVDLSRNLFKSFRIVKGDDIHHFYQTSQYANGKGSLGKSCMRNAVESKTLLYTTNPDKCSMVILVDKFKSDGNPEKIKGRALLWLADNGEFIMDRIYTNKDSDVELFKEFAKASNFWSKKSQSAGYVLIELSGVTKKIDQEVTMDLSKTNQSIGYHGIDIELPYVDSFSLPRDRTTKDETGKYSKVVMVGIGK